MPNNDAEIETIFNDWYQHIPEKEQFLASYLLVILQRMFNGLGIQSSKILLTYLLLYRDKPETRIRK